MNIARLRLCAYSLPLIKPIRQNETALLLKGLPKRWFFSYRFGLSMNQAMSKAELLGPRRHQAPLKLNTFLFLRSGIDTDACDQLRRSDVITRVQGRQDRRPNDSARCVKISLRVHLPHIERVSSGRCTQVHPLGIYH